PDHLDCRGAVGRLADHLDAVGGREDEHQAGADRLLIVGDHDPDAHGLTSAVGSTAPTRHPPAPAPAESSPPSSSARSRMPITPEPEPGTSAGSALTGFVTASKTAESPYSTRTSAGPAPCLSALVRDSCTMRYAARSTLTGSGRALPVTSTRTLSPVAR